jgi:hypothetical protein
MLDTVCGADHVKPHGPGIRSVTVALHLTKLDAVVGYDCADFKGTASNTAYRNPWAVWAFRRLSPAVVIFHAAAQQRCSEDRVRCTMVG